MRNFSKLKLKEWFSGLKSKSSQQLVPSLSDRVTTIYEPKQEFYGRAGAKKCRSQKIKKFKARSEVGKA